jgi:LysR family transcriptional regulator, regulator of abg operon
MIGFFDHKQGMGMTLAQLRMFEAVVAHGSIRAAARALGTAQSALTEGIASLERSLGVPILARSNKGVTLTVYGEDLRRRAGAILAECERTEEALKQMRGDPVGAVSLGVTSEPLFQLLTPVLSEFRSRFPAVGLHIVSAPSHTLISKVRGGQLDFAMVLLSPAVDVNDLMINTLYQSEPAIICRKDHPLRHATSLKSLANCEWINVRLQHATGPARSRIDGLFEAHGLGQPRVAITTDSLLETLHFVAGSDYLALEPRAVLDHPFFSSSLARIAIEEKPHLRDISLVQRSLTPLTPVAQELSSMLVSYSRLVRRGHQ